MSNQKVTYENSRAFESASDSQNTIRPEETHGPREVGNKIALGILCLLLMMAISVWLIHIFQSSQEKHELQKDLSSLHQENNTMKNDSYLCDKMLRNKSMEYNVLKNELDSLRGTLNRCYQENKVDLDCKRPTGKLVDGHWYCCGIKCYYFIKAKKYWRECKQTCGDCGLSLLKIDDHSELKSLQLRMNTVTYWTGLSYNTNERKWLWIDNDPTKL
ncbi:hypothetical protein HispidOSU_027848 [Sigmodon hispidus]